MTFSRLRRDCKEYCVVRRTCWARTKKDSREGKGMDEGVRGTMAGCRRGHNEVNF